MKVVARDVFDTSYPIGARMLPVVEDAQPVPEGGEVVRGTDADGNAVSLRARYGGVARVAKGEVMIRTIEEESREYPVPASAQLIVRDGSEVLAGDRLTEGSISPQELLLVRGRDDVQNYLVREVQNVYRSQGVDINDKHIEVIVRQMMRKVRVENAGDSELLPGEIISQFEWEEANAKALSEGGEPAIAQTVLLGLIKAALNTASWLSAASFQETTRVLTEAAISGKVDRLRGLKENVIIGKLIPAGTGLDYYTKLREEAVRLYEYDDLEDLEGEMGADDGSYGHLTRRTATPPRRRPPAPSRRSAPTGRRGDRGARGGVRVVLLWRARDGAGRRSFRWRGDSAWADPHSHRRGRRAYRASRGADRVRSRAAQPGAAAAHPP